jgi:hypothetical protein
MEESRLVRDASPKMTPPKYFLSTTGLNQSNPARQFYVAEVLWGVIELPGISGSLA